MATAALTTPTAGSDFVNTLSNPTAAASQTGEMSDRFLKLLVTQMQNQDPLNPLDNAQVTTQMAQINTVSGIEKLNQSVNSMSTMLSEKLGGLSLGGGLEQLNGTLQTLQGQMLQSQALQGASLVGRSVLVQGSALSTQGGTAGGAFELAQAADRVTVEVLGPAGQVLDTLDLGAQSAGRGGFAWNPPAGTRPEGLSFRVKATAGAVSVPAQTLMTDTVRSVSAGAGGLVLDLVRGGPTAFNLVKAVT